MKSKIAPFLLVMISGCASSYKLPATKPFSPEAEGKGKISLQGGIRQFYKTTLTSDIATVAIKDSDHTVEIGTTGGFSSNYGILPWLDLGISLDVSTYPLYYLKGQFLGENKQNADEGNISGSVIFGVASGKTVSESASASLFSSTTGSIQYTNETGLDLGFQFGYRTSKPVVLTLGLNGFWQTVSGKQVLNGAVTTFVDKPRLLEINGGAILYPSMDQDGSNTFIHPTIQYGRLNTFGADAYRFTYSIELGHTF